MPVQVVPPMYRMLVAKLQDVVADGDPYNFTHSSAYHLTPEEETRCKLVESSELGRSRNSVCGFHAQDGKIAFIAQRVEFRYRCRWKSEWPKEIPANIRDPFRVPR
ncbi:hypothetical protein F5J12DRAFT_840333 [Pisolithus orientalis]|uniref:uncharacterized protein n=1 Tax=Pisolithus orientalis TaxID=936130 RepID=UPI00222510BE|nr:uncharacterized protein F5J12DRAFT_840333 [Pisolithus orientalis]KAI6002645.1 hypothetical protein F5J12DRAFT_840333 [Pisolithus orientalis]